MVRLLRRRLDAEIAQQTAGRGIPQRHLLNLPQVHPVLRQNSSGADPFEQSLPGGLLLLLRFAGSERGGDLLRRTAGHPFRRSAPEPDVARNKLPGGRGRLRRIGRIGKQQKLRKRQCLAIHEFEQFGTVRLRQPFRRQRRNRSSVEEFHILGAHAFRGAALHADFDLLFIDRGHRREFSMIEHQSSGIQ